MGDTNGANAANAADGAGGVLRYYRGSLLFTAVAVGLAAWLGWSIAGTASGMLSTVWIVLVLGVLEVSLSFDNAVVNATVLRDMDAVWRRRFLTWGIAIAVFGMRIVFPLAIVAIAARLGPVDAVRLAATDPVTYERIITGAHVGISGFGGAFLAMVGLGFFLDDDKDVHWIGGIEAGLARLAHVPALRVAIVLLALYAVSRLLAPADALALLGAGLLGLVAYIAVDAFGEVMGADDAAGTAGRAGLAGFLYLELLDASFSFDGVIGAFALSNNLFVIALGLGVGAMFVRSMTVMLVDRGTLADYRYLEHGAFYAILALAIIMLLSARFAIPETLTGLIGAGLIGVAFLASLSHNRRDAAIGTPAADPVGPTGRPLS